MVNSARTIGFMSLTFFKLWIYIQLYSFPVCVQRILGTQDKEGASICI